MVNCKRTLNNIKNILREKEISCIFHPKKKKKTNLTSKGPNFRSYHPNQFYQLEKNKRIFFLYND